MTKEARKFTDIWMNFKFDFSLTYETCPLKEKPILQGEYLKYHENVWGSVEAEGQSEVPEQSQLFRLKVKKEFHGVQGEICIWKLGVEPGIVSNKVQHRFVNKIRPGLQFIQMVVLCKASALQHLLSERMYAVCSDDGRRFVWAISVVFTPSGAKQISPSAKTLILDLSSVLGRLFQRLLELALPFPLIIALPPPLLFSCFCASLWFIVVKTHVFSVTWLMKPAGCERLKSPHMAG